MTDHKQRFEALKARYPYMFVECIGHMQKGWLPVFEELCHQVDPLGGEEAQLQWVQLEEKRGHASWIVKFRNKTRANTLRLLQMSDLILAAEASTAKICIVCGEPGQIDVGLVWLHGHMHHAIDYTVNGTNVVANPRGYMRQDSWWENRDYEPAMLIEV